MHGKTHTTESSRNWATWHQDTLGLPTLCGISYRLHSCLSLVICAKDKVCLFGYLISNFRSDREYFKTLQEWKVPLRIFFLTLTARVNSTVSWAEPCAQSGRPCVHLWHSGGAHLCMFTDSPDTYLHPSLNMHSRTYKPTWYKKR